MKNKDNGMVPFIAGLVLFIAGLFMLINPAGCVKFVVVLLGLGSVALSVYNIIYTNKNFNDENYRKMVLIKSCTGIIFGIFAVVFALPFAATAWNVIVYIFAIYLVLAAAFGFYTVSLLKDVEIDRKRSIFENLGLLVAAVLIFLITPNTLGKIIIRVFGLIALVAGLCLVVTMILTIVKSKKNTLAVNSADVTVVDEPEDSSDKEEKE